MIRQLTKTWVKAVVSGFFFFSVFVFSPKCCCPNFEHFARKIPQFSPKLGGLQPPSSPPGSYAYGYGSINSMLAQPHTGHFSGIWRVTAGPHLGHFLAKDYPQGSCYPGVGHLLVYSITQHFFPINFLNCLPVLFGIVKKTEPCIKDSAPSSQIPICLQSYSMYPVNRIHFEGKGLKQWRTKHFEPGPRLYSQLSPSNHFS